MNRCKVYACVTSLPTCHLGRLQQGRRRLWRSACDRPCCCCCQWEAACAADGAGAARGAAAGQPQATCGLLLLLLEVVELCCGCCLQEGHDRSSNSQAGEGLSEVFGRLPQYTHHVQSRLQHVPFGWRVNSIATASAGGRQMGQARSTTGIMQLLGHHSCLAPMSAVCSMLHCYTHPAHQHACTHLLLLQHRLPLF
jgi:hypothetical protein